MYEIKLYKFLYILSVADSTSQIKIWFGKAIIDPGYHTSFTEK